MVVAVLFAGADDVWVLFLEAAFAMMAGGKDQIDIDCYRALDGGHEYLAVMALLGGSHGMSPAKPHGLYHTTITPAAFLSSLGGTMLCPLACSRPASIVAGIDVHVCQQCSHVCSPTEARFLHM